MNFQLIWVSGQDPSVHLHGHHWSRRGQFHGLVLCRHGLAGTQLHHQLPFVPQSVYFLLLPAVTFGQQLQIEVPQDPGQDHAHFIVRKWLAETVARAETERLGRGMTVSTKRGW